MRPMAGWDNTQSKDGSFASVPAGGYICEVLGVKLDQSRNGNELLVLQVDIAEGPYKAFYRNEYERQKRNPNIQKPKWYGMFRQLTTDTDGSPNGFFKGLITSFEESNPNFKWDWDEHKLKGKKIGFIFREEEYEKNGGSVGSSVKPTWPRSVDTIRKGVQVPPPKKLNKQASGSYGGGFGQNNSSGGNGFGNGFGDSSYNGFQETDDDELPF